MSFAWRKEALGLAVVLGMGLQACASTSAQQTSAASRATPGQNAEAEATGTESDAPHLRLAMARKQCELTARNVRGYTRAIAGNARVTGPDTTWVELYVGRPYSHTPLGCTYDAQAHQAHVP
ncbi:hypothetical protein [Stigmatella erecta]|uniref:Lipoprotein n=1 Tax=Stigmatella erecta TaxID=83460 RepID=A0A1I0LC15_9BACT|nr:hypothetical protein [Stigmatella erecta]SEU37604.1 hypothetical protein SAMN05443639_12466 [Stigmatella erecta]